MVERIRITPSQIVARDASGNIKFSTDYSYVKTGSGTSYVGGYQRAPAIYGEGSGVTDHYQYGGYVSEIKTGRTFFPEMTRDHYWYIPKSDTTAHQTFTDDGSLQQPGFVSPYWRTVRYYNGDTYQYSNTSASYKWAVAQYAYDPYEVDGSSYYGRVEWQIYPIFNVYSLPAVTNAGGGAFVLAYSANEWGTYSRTVTSTDYYGNSYTYTQYGSQFYTARTVTTSDESGVTTQNIPDSILLWRKNGMFSTRSPVGISLAVTP